MIRTTLLSMAALALLAVPSFAGDGKTQSSCCQTKAAVAKVEAQTCHTTATAKSTCTETTKGSVVQASSGVKVLGNVVAAPAPRSVVATAAKVEACDAGKSKAAPSSCATVAKTSCCASKAVVKTDSPKTSTANVVASISEVVPAATSAVADKKAAAKTGCCMIESMAKLANAKKAQASEQAASNVLASQSGVAMASKEACASTQAACATKTSCSTVVKAAAKQGCCSETGTVVKAAKVNVGTTANVVALAPAKGAVKAQPKANCGTAQQCCSTTGSVVKAPVKVNVPVSAGTLSDNVAGAPVNVFAAPAAKAQPKANCGTQQQCCSTKAGTVVKSTKRFVPAGNLVAPAPKSVVTANVVGNVTRMAPKPARAMKAQPKANCAGVECGSKACDAGACDDKGASTAPANCSSKSDCGTAATTQAKAKQGCCSSKAGTVVKAAEAKAVPVANSPAANVPAANLPASKAPTKKASSCSDAAKTDCSGAKKTDCGTKTDCGSKAKVSG